MSGAPRTADPAFEAHRGAIIGLAYRMLGSRTEAEDVAQDTWLRWHESVRADIADARAYLLRIAGNLCLDRLKSAQARREVYVGSWLPEPVLDGDPDVHGDAARAAEFADDVSYAFLLALDRLSPAERAAFLLHDVFGCAFDDVGGTLGRSAAACRQLATRARRHVRAARPRPPCPPEQASRLAAAFASALRGGDIEALSACLREDVRLVSDGGGRVAAVPQPVVGRERVAKVLLGFARPYRARDDIVVESAAINGLCGFVVRDADGVVQTIALEADAERAITAIYVVRNPDKLRRIGSR